MRDIPGFHNKRDIVELMRALQLSLILSLALPILAPRMANAQMMGAPGAKSMVAMMPDVQKELKVTKDQKKQIQDAISAMSKMGAGMDPTQMAAGGVMDMTSMNNQMDARVLASLSPDQMSRLTELWVQYNGPRVLQNDDVAKQLQLTDDQKSKIKAIWDDYTNVYMDQMRHIHIGSTMNGVKKKKKECDAATLALLTDDQNKAFASMQGKPFKFMQKNDF